MAVPDGFGFFIGGCTHEFHCKHDFFRLALLGNPLFLGNVDIFFDPKIRQLHSPGGVSTPKAIFFASSNVRKTNVSVRTLF